MNDGFFRRCSFHDHRSFFAAAVTLNDRRIFCIIFARFTTYDSAMSSPDDRNHPAKEGNEPSPKNSGTPKTPSKNGSSKTPTRCSDNHNIHHSNDPTTAEWADQETRDKQAAYMRAYRKEKKDQEEEERLARAKDEQQERLVREKKKADRAAYMRQYRKDQNE